MSLKTVLSPQAKQELREAFLWYENQEAGLGYEFLDSANASQTLLTQEPEMYPKIYRQVRRATIPKFPFGIYYVVQPERIFVLAIFHARRNPEEWKNRIPHRRKT